MKIYYPFLIFAFILSNINGQIFANNPDENTAKYQEFVNNLIQISGYSNVISITLLPSNDSNVKKSGAVAVCNPSNTVLYYAPFVENVYENGFPFSESNINETVNFDNSSNLVNWQQSGIFAHELGHVVLAHCKKYLANGKRKQAEVEADIFMGKVLHMFGATLKQAQSCMYLPIVNEQETKNYPSRKGRLNNVKKGWDSYKPNIDVNVEQDLIKARLLFIRDKVSDAFKILKKYEKTNYLDKQSLYILGFGYLFGYGTSPNIDKAEYYFLKCYNDYKMIDAAVQLSSIETQKKKYEKAIECGEFVINNVNINNIHLNGEKEIRKYRKIAITEFNTGDAYFLSGNKQKALKYYKRSAEKEFALAKLTLANYYYYYGGNNKLALFWIDQFLLEGFSRQDIVDLGGEEKAYELIKSAKQLKNILVNENKK